MSWLLFTLGAVYALLAFNAVHPPRRLGPVLAVPRFFAGWLTGELARHHAALLTLAVVALVWAGGVDGAPGWIGLGLAVAALGALLRLVDAGRETRRAFDRALDEALGDDHLAALEPATRAALDRPGLRGRHLFPLLLFDRGVERIADLRYAEGAGPRHLLDLYRPRGLAPDARAPVLLQIHGGAWMIGHKRQQGLPLVHHFAARGWVCVVINYRLAPRSRFPAQIIDVKRAIAWIREHVAEHGGDPDFIAATGGSAGGHLAALAALTPGRADWQPGFESVDTRLAACAPVYGVYDLADRHGQHRGSGLRWLLERWVMPAGPDDAPARRADASPVSHVGPEAPPFCVVHGTHDSLSPRAEAIHFVRALRSVANTPVVHVELDRGQHAFDVFHSPRTTETARGLFRFFEWARATTSARRAVESMDSRPARSDGERDQIR